MSSNKPIGDTTPIATNAARATLRYVAYSASSQGSDGDALNTLTRANLSKTKRKNERHNERYRLPANTLHARTERLALSTAVYVVRKNSNTVRTYR